MKVVAPKKYHELFFDVDNPGVIVAFLGYDYQCYSPMVARSVYNPIQENIFYYMVNTLGFVAPPILLYITWRKQLTVLQWIKDTKGGPAVMWACIAWMPLANLYLVLKLLGTFTQLAITEEVQKIDDAEFGTGVAGVSVYFGLAAVIQSGKALPGLPNITVLKSAIVRRVVKFHIWLHFDCLVAMVMGTSPFVALLVGTNPFLYGSALLAIVLAASLLILLTATLFTIGQVFLEDPDFRLTWREAVRQAGWLLLVGTGCVGVALFLGCICFLLLLSKNGNKVQSVSGVASFLMRHVVFTALPLLMNSLIRFIKNIHI